MFFDAVPGIVPNHALCHGNSADSFFLPGLLTAVFYDSVSETRGPRFVLSLSIIGLLLEVLWILMIRLSDNSMLKMVS